MAKKIKNKELLVWTNVTDLPLKEWAIVVFVCVEHEALYMGYF